MLSVIHAECHLCWASFILSVIYAECHLCWVSFMVSVIYGECHLCRVSFMLSVIYAECHLCWVSFMLSVIYSECHLCWVSFMLSVIILSVVVPVFYNNNKPIHCFLFINVEALSQMTLVLGFFVAKQSLYQVAVSKSVCRYFFKS